MPCVCTQGLGFTWLTLVSCLLSCTLALEGTASEHRFVTNIIVGKANEIDMSNDGEHAEVSTRYIGEGLEHTFLDPFLMFEEFAVRHVDEVPKARYPTEHPNHRHFDHPHRGFEVVTYVESGSIWNRDTSGHEALIMEGGLQWMTAGRGIVHSEMPFDSEGRHTFGFQLWVNLPKVLKMSEPRYQELTRDEVPAIASMLGARVKVLSGSFDGIKSTVHSPAVVSIFEVTCSAGAAFETELLEGFNGFIAVIEGVGKFGGNDVTGRGGQVLLLDATGEKVRAEYMDDDQADVQVDLRFYFIAGKASNESVVRRGPIVMTSEEEIQQALYDFAHGSFEEDPLVTRDEL